MPAVDHHRAPLLEALRRFKQGDFAPFSTPGHKRGIGADPELVELFGPDAFTADIPLSGAADDLHLRNDVLGQAEELGAAAWGAERSFYLLNGSSAGNHAYLLAALRPGDEIVVARDIHKSLLVAIILTGAIPVYVSPRLHPDLAVGLGIEPAAIGEALDRHPNAKLVALVSPSYCGVASDLAGIVHEAHGRGVPVYVDEAWGPHIGFHPDLPDSAMASGVDGAVASTHKVLGSLTQAAILNVQGGLVSTSRVATAVGMMNTTSPAVTILASIDACRRQMALHGEALLTRTIALARDARARLRALPGVGVLGADDLGLTQNRYDPTKLLVDVHDLGMTGFEVEEVLRHRFWVTPEMSDLVSIICLVTVGDTHSSIDRLVAAFEWLSENRRPVSTGGASLRSSGDAIAPGAQAMSPRDAFFAPARTVTLEDAVGQISAELVIPYPPGIPVLAPGDVIEERKLAYLRQGAAAGMYISGPADPALRTIQVVAKDKTGA